MVDADRQALLDLMHTRLMDALSPTHLAISDDSDQHIGHPGHKEGGHFTVTICSPAFTGYPLIACHRMVYQALGTLMDKQIHALAIKASAPES